MINGLPIIWKLAIFLKLFKIEHKNNFCWWVLNSLVWFIYNLLHHICEVCKNRWLFKFIKQHLRFYIYHQLFFTFSCRKKCIEESVKNIIKCFNVVEMLTVAFDECALQKKCGTSSSQKTEKLLRRMLALDASGPQQPIKHWSIRKYFYGESSTDSSK